jgi:hypothetical protein
VQPSDLALNAPLGPISLTPQDVPRWAGKWTILSSLFSMLILGAVLIQISQLSFTTLFAMIPATPLFGLAFIVGYFAGPTCEWLIFKRLWNIPAAGFPALIRKVICNELLLGYLGEVYFYTWARQRLRMTTAPFGAIKDVAILSAIAGNGVTLALLVILWPLLGSTQLGLETGTVMLSLGLVLATSVGVMAFRKRIFSLPKGELRFVFNIHLFRIALSTLLVAWLWHLALPAVPVLWWFFLATVRLLISRLPFIPNKDLVFAGLAVFLVGNDADIAALMTLTAGLTLALHALIGGALGVWSLIPGENKQ